MIGVNLSDISNIKKQELEDEGYSFDYDPDPTMIGTKWTGECEIVSFSEFMCAATKLQSRVGIKVPLALMFGEDYEG